MSDKATRALEKWESNLATAGTAFIAGVNAVTEAPGEKAAKSVDRMIQKLIDLKNSGELQRRMRSVSLDEWKRATIEKGADRLASGAAAGKPKMERFLNKFIPYLEREKAKLPPRGTREQNKQRMLKQYDINSAFSMDD